MIVPSKCLPQDDICWCGIRIGNHNDYGLWKCLQKTSNNLLELRKAIQRWSAES